MAAVLGRHIHTYTRNSTTRNSTVAINDDHSWSLNSCEVTPIHIHYLPVAITTPEGGLWGCLSLQITHPANLVSRAFPSGDEVATQPRKGWPHHRGLRSKSAIGVSVFYVRQEPDERNLHSHGKAPLGRGWSNNSTPPKDHTGSTTPTRAIMIPSI